MASWTCLYAQNEQVQNTANDNGNVAKPTIEHLMMSQSFAIDTKTQTMAVVDTPENKIVVLNRTKDGYSRTNDYLVDITRKRHNLQAIFRPKSVAIYNDSIVFVASNRDSSYIGVLDIKGNVIKISNKFLGAVSTMSYDKESGRLYVGGLNPSGYNIFDIDVSTGFANIFIDTVSNDKAAYELYSIPRKSEEISKHDPYGLGLTMIAMGTVFSVLIIISIILMNFARVLRKIQNKREKKANGTQATAPAVNVPTAQSSQEEELAAVATAVYLYSEDMHDTAPRVLTIKDKEHSAWNNKIHNMNIYRR